MSPSKPEAQLQLNPFTPSTHVPPFMQESGLQSSMSINVNFCLDTTLSTPLIHTPIHPLPKCMLVYAHPLLKCMLGYMPPGQNEPHTLVKNITFLQIRLWALNINEDVNLLSSSTGRGGQQSKLYSWLKVV